MELKALSFKHISTMTLWTNYMTKTIFKNEQVNERFIIPRIIFILKAKIIALFKF